MIYGYSYSTLSLTSQPTLPLTGSIFFHHPVTFGAMHVTSVSISINYSTTTKALAEVILQQLLIVLYFLGSH